MGSITKRFGLLSTLLIFFAGLASIHRPCRGAEILWASFASSTNLNPTVSTGALVSDQNGNAFVCYNMFDDLVLDKTPKYGSQDLIEGNFAILKFNQNGSLEYVSDRFFWFNLGSIDTITVHPDGSLDFCGEYIDVSLDPKFREYFGVTGTLTATGENPGYLKYYRLGPLGGGFCERPSSTNYNSIKANAGIPATWILERDAEGNYYGAESVGQELLGYTTQFNCSSLIVKISPSGKLVWTTKIDACIYSLAVNLDGTIYVAGGYKPGATFRGESFAPNNGSGLFTALLGPGRWEQPPMIRVHPIGQTVAAGEPVTMQVQVEGEGPFQFQWLKDGLEVQAGTNRSLAFPNSEIAVSGEYSVRIRNDFGEVTSKPAILTVFDETRVTPGSVRLETGKPVELVASGGPPGGNWQWYQNEKLIPGQTNSTLVIGIEPLTSGRYEARRGSGGRVAWSQPVFAESGLTNGGASLVFSNSVSGSFRYENFIYFDVNDDCFYALSAGNSNLWINKITETRAFPLTTIPITTPEHTSFFYGKSLLGGPRSYERTIAGFKVPPSKTFEIRFDDTMRAQSMSLFDSGIEESSLSYAKLEKFPGLGIMASSSHINVLDENGRKAWEAIGSRWLKHTSRRLSFFRWSLENLTRLAFSGDQIWSNQLVCTNGGRKQEIGPLKMTSDSQANFYLSGSCRGDLWWKGNQILTNASTFILKLNRSGEVLWANDLSGNLRKFAADDLGNLYALVDAPNSFTIKNLVAYDRQGGQRWSVPINSSNYEIAARPDGTQLVLIGADGKSVICYSVSQSVSAPAPRFISQTRVKLTEVGNIVPVEAEVISYGAARYQWFKDGSKITAATSRDLNVSVGQEGGVYALAVSTKYGATTNLVAYVGPLEEPRISTALNIKNVTLSWNIGAGNVRLEVASQVVGPFRELAFSKETDILKRISWTTIPAVEGRRFYRLRR